MSDLYRDGTYLKNNPTWHTEHSSWKADQIIRIMKSNNIEPATVCEVGCGAGEILIHLYNSLSGNIAFFGYEISPQAFKLCMEKKHDRVQFSLTDILQEENAFYDLILAIDVFEHVEDYLGFLKALRNKGKYKIFHIPLDMTVRNVLKDSTFIQLRKSVGHIHYFTKRTALAVLENCGYEIIDSFYTKGSIDLPEGGVSKSLRKIARNCLFSTNRDLTVKMLGGFSLMVLTE